jgi:hypothetical protein
MLIKRESLSIRRGIDIYDRWSLVLIVMTSISTGLYLAFALLEWAWNRGVMGEVVAGPDVSLNLQDILNKAHQGPLYTYPTSLTQGIVPVSFGKPLPGVVV